VNHDPSPAHQIDPERVRARGLSPKLSEVPDVLTFLVAVSDSLPQLWPSLTSGHHEVGLSTWSCRCCLKLYQARSRNVGSVDCSVAVCSFSFLTYMYIHTIVTHACTSRYSTDRMRKKFIRRRGCGWDCARSAGCGSEDSTLDTSQNWRELCRNGVFLCGRKHWLLWYPTFLEPDIS
jgi:hypothetical protein